MDRLNQINMAISAIEQGAQEYQIGTRRIKKAELSVLYQERITRTRKLWWCDGSLF